MAESGDRKKSLEGGGSRAKQIPKVRFWGRERKGGKQMATSAGGN